MAIVTIQAPALSDVQKKRVGERILDSLHSEGVPASSIVVLFRQDDTDIFLDGGILFEAKPRYQVAAAASASTVTTVSKRPSVAAAKTPAPPPAPVKAPEPAPAPAKGRGRGRTAPAAPHLPKKALPTFAEAKEKIRSMLLNHGGLSSFQAQSGLDLKGHDGASALLRKIFADLELEGLVEKQGQKRGTRYVLKGIATAPPHQTTPVILVKHDKSEDDHQGEHHEHQTHGNTEDHNGHGDYIGS